MTIFKKIAGEVQQGNSENVVELVKGALSSGTSAEAILNQGLVNGMTIVSEKFKNNECFIPEVLVSAKAMNLGLQVLKPRLAETNVKSLGKVVMGTIQGDLHDIGKNITAMLLRGAGFEVIDLGADVPIEKFIETARKEKADMVGMSALLITTMVNMKPVIEGLKEAGLKDDIKVIVGGAPVTRDYAEQIGADGYAEDAASGVDVAKQLLKN
ncbi:MAG: corrinoid protein [Candidatus Aminicenantes bacterium]|jgi:5-methyltetrahydrofolate--homocysteine methyltransferase|nr:corrinoid protein [Candidatus Aminicenantes bacterium]